MALPAAPGRPPSLVASRTPPRFERGVRSLTNDLNGVLIYPCVFFPYEKHTSKLLLVAATTSSSARKDTTRRRRGGGFLHQTKTVSLWIPLRNESFHDEVKRLFSCFTSSSIIPFRAESLLRVKRASKPSLRLRALVDQLAVPRPHTFPSSRFMYLQEKIFVASKFRA